MRQYLVLLLLCASSMPLRAQNPALPDTGRVVILSERVGAVIDSTEREKFGLFTGILIRHFGSTGSFRNAVVLQLPDSTFRVRFTVGGQNGSQRDTLLTYSIGALWLLSQKINHFEEIESGRYRLTQEAPPLQSVKGTLIFPEPIKRPMGSTGYGTLPLAPAERYPYPRYFPALDFGIGLRTYDPDLSGLTGVFGKVPSLGLSPFVSAITEIALTEAFALQLEGGMSVGGEEAFQGSIGGIYYVPLTSSKKVRAFLEAAILLCSFNARQSGIIVEGGGAGASVTAGLQLLLGTSMAVDIYAGYSALPEVNTQFTDYSSTSTGIPASVDMSSAMFGLRIKFLQ